MDRDVASAAGFGDALRGQLRRPAGRVALLLVVHLDDLDVRHERGAASAASFIISTAPTEKFGTSMRADASRSSQSSSKRR